jgi:hypothetical protein
MSSPKIRWIFGFVPLCAAGPVDAEAAALPLISFVLGSQPGTRLSMSSIEAVIALRVLPGM